MIVTLTLNPSLDLTYALAEDALTDRDIHRTRTQTLEPSGKGVNVSLDLHAAGVPTRAVLPTAGGTGRHLSDLLDAAGLAHRGVAVAGECRINTSLLLADGRTIKVNGPGSPLAEPDFERTLATLVAALDTPSEAGERWLVVAGSLPPGIAPESVCRILALAREHGYASAADLSGPALRAALDAGADLIAPNDLELAELTGDPTLTGATPEAVADAAAGLARASGSEVLVSMGAAGAVWSDGKRALHGSGPALTPVNTAGAGDAFLAGWLAAPGDPTQRMARALAWGRSSCLCPTTVDPQPGTRGSAGIRVRKLRPHTDPTPEGSQP